MQKRLYFFSALKYNDRNQDKEINYMKKFIGFIALILMLVMLTVTVAACSSKTDVEYIDEKGTLVIGVTYFAPMNYFDDGDFVGFDTEFATAVCEKLGLEPKFQIIDWDAKFLELNSKSIDCIWNGFTVDDDRKARVEFTQSYLYNEQCAVVRTADLAQYTTVASFAGKRGVAEIASAGEPVAQELSAQYAGVASQSATLLELQSFTADFTVIDKTMAQAVVGTGEYDELSIVSAVTLKGEEYAVGFRKASGMAARVNAVIDELLADGTLLALAEKYELEDLLIQ